MCGFFSQQRSGGTSPKHWMLMCRASERRRRVVNENQCRRRASSNQTVEPELMALLRNFTHDRSKLPFIKRLNIHIYESTSFVGKSHAKAVPLFWRLLACFGYVYSSRVRSPQKVAPLTSRSSVKLRSSRAALWWPTFITAEATLRSAVGDEDSGGVASTGSCPSWSESDSSCTRNVSPVLGLRWLSHDPVVSKHNLACNISQLNPQNVIFENFAGLLLGCLATNTLCMCLCTQ